VERCVAGDEFDVLLGGAELQCHVFRGKRTNDIEDEAPRQNYDSLSPDIRCDRNP
jgi:hypothetical protein